MRWFKVAILLASPLLASNLYIAQEPDSRVSGFLSVQNEGAQTTFRLVCLPACLGPAGRYEQNALSEYTATSRAPDSLIRSTLAFRLTAGSPARSGRSFSARLQRQKDGIQLLGRGRRLFLPIQIERIFYHAMQPEGSPARMLYIAESQKEFLLWEKKAGGPQLSFIRNGSRLEGLQTGSVEVRLNHGKKRDQSVEPGLLWDCTLILPLRWPDGSAGRFEMDMIRTPVSDISGRLYRAGQPVSRFTQANDSNLRVYAQCADSSCRQLWRAERLALLLMPDRPLVIELLDENQGRLPDASPVQFIWKGEDKFVLVLNGRKLDEFILIPD
jgi:hypothetical protein